MTLFACLLSFLSIGLLVFGFLLVSSEKVVMLQSISNLTNRFDQIVDQNQILLDSMSTTDDIAINTWANLNVLNENQQNELPALDEKLFDFQFIFSNDKLYFPIQKEDDLESEVEYDSIDLKNYSLFMKLSSNDYDKILSYLKDAIRTVIENPDIKKEKVTVSYNGQEKRVNRLTYQITKDSLKEILTTFINYIKQDKTLKEHISTIHSLSSSDLNQKLDLLKESINFSNDAGFTYHVYYYGFNQIFRYELETEDSTYQIAYQIDNQEHIEINRESTCIFYLDMTDNKKQINFTGYILNEKEQKIPIKGNRKENRLTLIITSDNQEIQCVFTHHANQKEEGISNEIILEVSKLLENQEEKLLSIDFHFEFLKQESKKLTED